jgi:hypothetical protein
MAGRGSIDRTLTALALGLSISSVGCFHVPQTEAEISVLGHEENGRTEDVPVVAVPVSEVDKTLPKLAGTIPPLVEGKGRIVFDCVGIRRPCVVEEILSETTGRLASTEARKVCVETPCWADFDYGPHSFDFIGKGIHSCAPYFEPGVCGGRTRVMVVATTNPMVVLVSPGFEEHSLSPRSRRSHHLKYLTFEVARGAPYYVR